MQRTANILAQNLLHKTTRDVTINGYKIPANTTILPQISVVHLDENVFPHPERFDPQRFIDSKTGQVSIEMSNVINYFIRRPNKSGTFSSRKSMNLYRFRLASDNVWEKVSQKWNCF